MKIPPLENERHSTTRHFTIHIAVCDSNGYLVPRVPDMKVSRLMLTVIHGDDDSEESAKYRHSRILHDGPPHPPARPRRDTGVTTLKVGSPEKRRVRPGQAFFIFDGNRDAPTSEWLEALEAKDRANLLGMESVAADSQSEGVTHSFRAALRNAFKRVFWTGPSARARARKAPAARTSTTPPRQSRAIPAPPPASGTTASHGTAVPRAERR